MMTLERFPNDGSKGALIKGLKGSKRFLHQGSERCLNQGSKKYLIKLVQGIINELYFCCIKLNS